MRINILLAAFFISILILAVLCDDKKEPKKEENKEPKKEEKKPEANKDSKKQKVDPKAQNKKRATLNEKMKISKPFPDDMKIIPTSQTCMEIAMAVTASDKDTFESLTTRAMELNEELGEEDARNFVLSFYLANCIQHIDPIEISMIRSQKQSKMEVDYIDFKDSLKYEEVNEALRKNDSKKISEYQAKVELFNRQYKEAMQKYQDRMGGDAFKRRGDVGIFGNKFKEMPKRRTYIIGISLLIVVFSVLGYLLFKLLKFGKKEKKKKKDKEGKKSH